MINRKLLIVLVIVLLGFLVVGALLFIPDDRTQLDMIQKTLLYATFEGKTP